MVTMTDNLNPNPSVLRSMAYGQLLLSVFVCISGLARMGPVKFAANGLPVLGSQGMDQAELWRIAGFAIPGLLMVVVAAWLWWRAQDGRLRMASVLLVMTGLAHAAQALVPIDLTYLLNPVNQTAALLNTVWWLAGTAACVMLAWSGKRSALTIGLALAVVVTALLRIGEVLPGGMHALTGWAQWLVFGLALAKSVR